MRLGGKFESTARKGPALACVGAIFVNIVGLYRQQSFLLKWGYYSALVCGIRYWLGTRMRSVAILCCLLICVAY